MSNFFFTALLLTIFMDNDPLMFALDLTRRGNKKMSSFIDNVLSIDDHIASERSQLIQNALLSDKSKVRTYISINPSCTTHPMYDKSYSSNTIPEHQRIRITQMRTSAHRLKVETLRWVSTARENRKCQCNLDIQDEKHILVACPRTQHLRDAINSDILFPNLLNSTNPVLAKYIFDATSVFY